MCSRTVLELGPKPKGGFAAAAIFRGTHTVFQKGITHNNIKTHVTWSGDELKFVFGIIFRWRVIYLHFIASDLNFSFVKRKNVFYKVT